jgi:ketosteroid isomerase-like protein
MVHIVAFNGVVNEEFEVSADNTVVVRSFWEFVSSNRGVDAVALCDEQSTYWINGAMPVSGLAPKEVWEKYFTEYIPNAFQGTFKMEIRRILVDGDIVVIETESFATHESGRAYHNRYTVWHELRDGRIVSFREYPDTQLGTELLTEW